MPSVLLVRTKYGVGVEAALIALSVIYGLLSALRWPQIYTVTQMLIDYHFGFGKRGLIGFLIHGFLKTPYRYGDLALIAFAIFVMWMALLAGLVWKRVIAIPGLSIPIVLFFFSAGFSSLVCDIGRGEHFGLLLALVCLLLPATFPWLPMKAGVLVIAVLMQEVNFIIFVPLVAFDSWIGAGLERRWRAASWVAVAMVPVVMLTWYLGDLRTACASGATAYFQHMAGDFNVDWQPIATLCNNGHANFQIAATYLWSIGSNAAQFPLALSVALPSTILNLALTIRLMRRRPFESTMCLCAVFAPILLLIVAADVVRFVTLIQLTSLLALISAIRRLVCRMMSISDNTMDKAGYHFTRGT